MPPMGTLPTFCPHNHVQTQDNLNVPCNPKEEGEEEEEEEEEEEQQQQRHFGCLATFWFGTLRCFLAPLGVLFIMKTHEDEL